MTFSRSSVLMIFGWFCALPVPAFSTPGYFVDHGECRCVPYTKYCGMEVIEVSMQTAFSRNTMTCWYGTRLCCDLTSLQNNTQMLNHFTRGVVVRRPPSQSNPNVQLPNAPVHAIGRSRLRGRTYSQHQDQQQSTVEKDSSPVVSDNPMKLNISLESTETVPVNTDDIYTEDKRETKSVSVVEDADHEQRNEFNEEPIHENNEEVTSSGLWNKDALSDKKSGVIVENQRNESTIKDTHNYEENHKGNMTMDNFESSKTTIPVATKTSPKTITDVKYIDPQGKNNKTLSNGIADQVVNAKDEELVNNGNIVYKGEHINKTCVNGERECTELHVNGNTQSEHAASNSNILNPNSSYSNSGNITSSLTTIVITERVASSVPFDLTTSQPENPALAPTTEMYTEAHTTLQYINTNLTEQFSSISVEALPSRATTSIISQLTSLVKNTTLAIVPGELVSSSNENDSLLMTVLASKDNSETSRFPSRNTLPTPIMTPSDSVHDTLTPKGIAGIVSTSSVEYATGVFNTPTLEHLSNETTPLFEEVGLSSPKEDIASPVFTSEVFSFTQNSMLPSKEEFRDTLFTASLSEIHGTPGTDAKGKEIPSTPDIAHSEYLHSIVPSFSSSLSSVSGISSLTPVNLLSNTPVLPSLLEQTSPSIITKLVAQSENYDILSPTPSEPYTTILQANSSPQDSKRLVMENPLNLVSISESNFSFNRSLPLVTQSRTALSSEDFISSRQFFSSPTSVAPSRTPVVRKEQPTKLKATKTQDKEKPLLIQRITDVDNSFSLRNNKDTRSLITVSLYANTQAPFTTVSLYTNTQAPLSTVSLQTNTLLPLFIDSAERPNLSKFTEIHRGSRRNKMKLNATRSENYYEYIDGLGIAHTDTATTRTYSSSRVGLPHTHSSSHVGVSHMPEFTMVVTSPNMNVSEKQQHIKLFPMYIKPSQVSQEKFRAFLQSLREEKFNKTNHSNNEETGFWGWLFG